MVQGSESSIHIQAEKFPFHPEAYEMAEMGFIPAVAYRNREYAEAGVCVTGNVSRAMQDICYDPQTSGGLLMAVPEECASDCLKELQEVIPLASVIGYVTERQEAALYLE